MDISSLNLEAGSVALATSQAYNRVETVSDFVDIVYLALSGYDVSYEPVSGSLTGFPKPLPPPIIIRRISNQHPDLKAEKAKLPNWHISCDGTPQSVAKAIRSLLSTKTTVSAVTLDLSGIGQGDVAVVYEKMFTGICRCLSQRAGRVLDATDIADLLQWVAPIAGTKMDAQVRYGSYPHWGSYMRGEQVDPARAWTSPPDVSNSTRSLLCSVPPTAEDLRMVAAIGKPFGIINVVALRVRAPWAASVSADRTLSLGNYAACPVASYKPSQAIIDEASTPLPPCPPGRNVHASVEARFAPVWADLRVVSAAMYAETMKPLPSPLQAAWSEKREGQHPYAILVSPVVGDIADLARHALDGGIKAAKSFSAPMPLAVTSTPAASLDEGVANASGLIAHGGAIVCGDVDAILANWDGVVAVVVNQI